jgi:cytochrome c oxidase, subunit II
VRMPVFRRTKRWLALLGCVLLSSILLSACGDEASTSILNVAGPIAYQERILFYIIVGLAGFIFLGVEGMLLFSVFRYRERPNTPNPYQNHGNLALEAIWTGIPTVILFVLLFFTIRGLLQVAPEAEPNNGNTVVVQAVGHQWWWEFYYPQYNITTADEMVIPEKATIHVDLFSNNVIHSFWVPNLTGKTDLVPGHANYKWFIADRTGPFTGICAEYCGTQHGNMRFEVQSVSSDAFKTWISTKQQAAAAPTGALAQQGQAIFKNQCATCHGIVGVNVTQYYNPMKSCTNPAKQPTSSPQCLIGPNLTHFGSRDLIAGGVLTNNSAQCDPNNPNLLKECHLAQWLNDPQGIKPGNDMNIGQLTPDQIRQLVAYLESLK